MKKTIVFLVIVIFGLGISMGQEKPCHFKIYKLVFEESKLFKNKAVEIELGYKPSEFVVSSISEMNLFSKNEIEQFKKLPDNLDNSHCAKLNRQVELLLSDDRIGENGGYMKYFFSNVISLSDSKKAVLMSTAMKNKNYEGGKAIGNEMIYILSNNKGKWSLIDKKSLAMY